MKKTIFVLFFLLAVSTLAAATETDFGADGLKGISAEQQKMLVEGKIAFSTQTSQRKIP